jgi:hypothetical protein
MVLIIMVPYLHALGSEGVPPVPPTIFMSAVEVVPPVFVLNIGKQQ